MRENISFDESATATRAISGQFPGAGEIQLRIETVPMLQDSGIMLAQYAGHILNMAPFGRWRMLLSLLRLLLIRILSVVAFTMWLIIHNHLWQRRNPQEARWREKLDNLATIVTIDMTVMSLYVLVHATMRPCSSRRGW